MATKSQKKIEILPEEDHTDNEYSEDEDLLVLEKPIVEKPKKERKKRVDAKLVLDPVYAKREPKPKKERSPAQIAAWEATLKRREEVRQERMGKRDALKQTHEKEKVLARRLAEYELNKKVEEEKKRIEEQLVKKAIAVKKRALKKQALLDEISASDDEEPVIAKRLQLPKKYPPAVTASHQTPRYVFL